MATMRRDLPVQVVRRTSGAPRARHLTQLLRMVAALSLAAAPCELPAQAPGSSDWGYYGGDALGQHFSTLDQINRGNVARLTPA